MIFLDQIYIMRVVAVVVVGLLLVLVEVAGGGGMVGLKNKMEQMLW